MDPIYYYLPDDQKINSYHLSRHIITLLNNQGGEIYVGMKDGDSISGVKNVKTKKLPKLKRFARNAYLLTLKRQ